MGSCPPSQKAGALGVWSRGTLGGANSRHRIAQRKVDWEAHPLPKCGENQELLKGKEHLQALCGGRGHRSRDDPVAGPSARGRHPAVPPSWPVPARVQTAEASGAEKPLGVSALAGGRWLRVSTVVARSFLSALGPQQWTGPGALGIMGNWEGDLEVSGEEGDPG